MGFISFGLSTTSEGLFSRSSIEFNIFEKNCCFASSVFFLSCHRVPAGPVRALPASSLGGGPGQQGGGGARGDKEGWARAEVLKPGRSLRATETFCILPFLRKGFSFSSRSNFFFLKKRVHLLISREKERKGRKRGRNTGG